MGLFGPPNVDKMKAKGDVRGLIKALNYSAHAHPTVSSDAARALGQIGAPAVGPLIVVLQEGNQRVRGYAAQALGELGDTRCGAAHRYAQGCGNMAACVCRLRVRENRGAHASCGPLARPSRMRADGSNITAVTNTETCARLSPRRWEKLGEYSLRDLSSPR
jgi:hypothetical protein